jgi:hypothetical protein
MVHRAGATEGRKFPLPILYRSLFAGTDRVGGRVPAVRFAIPGVFLTFLLGGLKVTVQVTEPEKPY